MFQKTHVNVKKSTCGLTSFTYK